MTKHKPPTPYFTVVLRLDATQLTQALMDFPDALQSARPESDGADMPVRPSRLATAPRGKVGPQRATKGSSLTLGAAPKGSMARSDMLAHQAAVKELAGRKSVTRQTISRAAMKSFEDAGLNPTGVSSAVSNLVKAGILRVVEGE